MTADIILKDIILKGTILGLRNITKAFGGVNAVNRCSFGIEENRITSLIGPNGAGKTTAFNIISGLVSPDSGKIYFENRDITRLKPHERALLGISRTFQSTRLFKYLSIKDNLLLAKNTDEKELLNVLRLVYMHKSLNTIASDLSYGQQRLVETARAFLMPHKLLMMDEPTAGVNPKIRQELKVILKRIKKEGKTILLIEHDMDFVMGVSDRIIVMNEGRVLKIGTPKEVRNDPKVLEAYLGK